MDLFRRKNQNQLFTKKMGLSKKVHPYRTFSQNKKSPIRNGIFSNKSCFYLPKRLVGGKANKSC